jgi:hypothetical protein
LDHFHSALGPAGPYAPAEIITAHVEVRLLD